MALHGFAKRFRENSDEERGHAMKLISYQNMRGGRVVFQDVCKPSAQEWNSALHAIGKLVIYSPQFPGEWILTSPVPEE